MYSHMRASSSFVYCGGGFGESEEVDMIDLVALSLYNNFPNQKVEPFRAAGLTNEEDLVGSQMLAATERSLTDCPCDLMHLGLRESICI